MWYFTIITIVSPASWIIVGKVVYVACIARIPITGAGYAYCIVRTLCWYIAPASAARGRILRCQSASRTITPVVA